MKPYTPLYRLLVWSARYLRPSDFLRLVILLPLGYLVWKLYPFRVEAAILGAAGVCGILMLGFIDTVKRRRAREYLVAEVLRGFFAQVHGELFPEDERLRITIFRQAPYSPQYIVPWFRYSSSSDGDLVREAQKSRAKYRKGEGFTGYAWQNAGTEIIIASFPKFRDRASFEGYYTQTLNIDADTVSRISDEMMLTRTVLSHGFVDLQENFLGVISVDIHAPLEVDDEKHARIGAMRIRSDVMVQLLNSIETVLEAFGRVEKRHKT